MAWESLADEPHDAHHSPPRIACEKDRPKILPEARRPLLDEQTRGPLYQSLYRALLYRSLGSDRRVGQAEQSPPTSAPDLRRDRFDALLAAMAAAWYEQNTFLFYAPANLVGFAALVGLRNCHRIRTIQLDSYEFFAGTSLCWPRGYHSWVELHPELYLLYAPEVFCVGIAATLFATPQDWDFYGSPPPTTRLETVLGLLGSLLPKAQTAMLSYPNEVHVELPTDADRRVCQLADLKDPSHGRIYRELEEQDWCRTLSRAMPSMRRVGFKTPMSLCPAVVWATWNEKHLVEAWPTWGPERTRWCRRCFRREKSWKEGCCLRVGVQRNCKGAEATIDHSRRARRAAREKACGCVHCSNHKLDPRKGQGMTLWGDAYQMREFLLISHGVRSENRSYGGGSSLCWCPDYLR